MYKDKMRNTMQIKKRFGQRSFVDYLHFYVVQSIGTKPRKEQQVYIANPQDSIIPQSGVNIVLYDMQQDETVAKKGASLNFAKYYGDDFDRNYGLNQNNLEMKCHFP